MGYNVVHIRFTNTQIEVMRARAAMEYKPLTQLIRNAVMEYCAYGPIVRKERPPKPKIQLEEPNESL